jgi:hypothetical protein
MASPRSAWSLSIVRDDFEILKDEQDTDRDDRQTGGDAGEQRGGA